jgi:hypothetical protein
VESRPAGARLAARAAGLAAAGLTLAAAGYAASTAWMWYGYGHPRRSSPEDADALLDRFLPEYEIVERHSIRVNAPAAVTLAAAREQDMAAHPVIRAIFRARELVMGAAPDAQVRPRALLPQVLSLGWIVLAEVPGREVVVGAVTRPWEANVVFRGVPPDEFASFAEPDYVKIVWSLRADPAAGDASVFRTETRAAATDAAARAKFRRYWSFVSPGIALIRRMSLKPLRAEAERRTGLQRSTLHVAER